MQQRGWGGNSPGALKRRRSSQSFSLQPGVTLGGGGTELRLVPPKRLSLPPKRPSVRSYDSGASGLSNPGSAVSSRSGGGGAKASGGRSSFGAQTSGFAAPKKVNSGNLGAGPGKFDFKQESPFSDAGSSGASPRRGSPEQALHSIPELYEDSTGNSAWYGSTLAKRLRQILHGKYFSGLMVLALLAAFFVPYIFILLEVGTNLEQDVVMSMVAVLFIIELFGLSAVDPAYFLSFFFVMDAVGTISMASDISFLVGSGNKVPGTVCNGAAMTNMTIMRAARATRIGARAGRLSRVLRILRLCTMDSGKGQSGGLAPKISAQLVNCVSTRIAKLVILLVLVVPLFDLMVFPQADYSLETWVNRLSELHRRRKLQTFHKELGDMVEFFSRHNYGPYKACHGYTSESGLFICDQEVTDWQPLKAEPDRMASALLIHTDSFMVIFNMHGPASFEATMGMVNIVLIIFIMVFSGLNIASVVTGLAVRPLQRMLVTVRQIATTVFKFSQEVVNSDDGEDEHDMDMSSEMELLEKVVNKLSIIADLQTRGTVERTEDMHDEDIGILNMMQGKNIVEEAYKPDRSARNAAHAGPISDKRQTLTIGITPADFGMTQELYQSWSFNSLPLSRGQKTTLAVFTVSRFNFSGEGFIQSREEELTLQRFIEKVESQYNANPFHNFSHAVDVTHIVGRLLRLTHSEGYLSDLEQFALLISAVAHDVGHPGTNNGFLSEVGHEVALRYNDRSCLENMHCALLYTIVGDKNTNVFGKMTREQYKEARKHCIETILHTDMMSHQGMVKDLQMVYQMNLEVFTSSQPDASDKYRPDASEMEVFEQPDVKVIVMNTILHSADVSNPCRDWEVTQVWAFAVLDEYFAQGDQEKELGIPVQFLNDRDKLNKPNSQIGFIEFMIAPFFAAQIRIWLGLHEFGELLVVNNSNWEEMWVKEVSPAEEERVKVRGRVERVKETIEDAKLRGAPKAGS